MRRRQNDYLFCGRDWFSVAESQRRTLQSEIDAMDGNRLLNTSVDDLCDYFEEKFRIDVPMLHEEQAVADQQEVQIDVSQDPMRFIRDRSRPFHVAGTLVEVTVPFSGESEAFRIRPTTFTTSLPRGEIRGRTLVITVQGPDLEPQQVKAEIDRTIGEINTPRLLGYRLVESRYERLAAMESIGRTLVLSSEVPGLELRAKAGGKMRFHDPTTGEELLSHGETHAALRSVRHRAETEANARRAAEARADAAEARVAELEARLREEPR